MNDNKIDSRGDVNNTEQYEICL